MTEYHVAIDHLDLGTGEVTTAYLGTVDQEHADQARAIAALDGTPRVVREHPRTEGAFMVLRDDGDLDVYAPVGATETPLREPDPEPADQDSLPRGIAGPAYVSGAV
ncbi:hypothetical protein ADL27_46365, partial [Streptomyces sp. NRRL F-6602]